MEHRPASILPLILGLFITSTSAAEESLSVWGEEFLHDGHKILTSPSQWQETQWQKAAGLTVVTAALMASADQGVADYYDQRRQARINDVMQGVGDVLSPVALAGYSAALWGVGQLVPNDTLSRSGFKMGEAVIYVTLITGGIKVVIGRARPSTGADASDFSGWSWRDDQQSFPSTHAAAAFAAARVLSPQLTTVQRVGAYGAATLVSYSRIYQGDHWLSDVIFGAGLGYAVGAILADEDGKNDPQQHGWWLIPTPSGVSLSWLQTW